MEWISHKGTSQEPAGNKMGGHNEHGADSRQCSSSEHETVLFKFTGDIFLPVPKYTIRYPIELTMTAEGTIKVPITFKSKCNNEIAIANTKTIVNITHNACRPSVAA
jgi:hypothetical protein